MKKLLSVAAMALALAACSSKSDQPTPTAEAAATPTVEVAMQECRTAVEANQQADQAKNQADFNACMKDKGFEQSAAVPSAAEPIQPAN